MKKNLKELIPLWSLIKHEKKKIIIACILALVCSVAAILFGYLMGEIIQYTTEGNIKAALICLIAYIFIYITAGNLLSNYSHASLRIVESNLAKKMSFLTYKKALNLPAVAYEEKSSGEIINRVANDTNSVLQTFSEFLYMILGILNCFIIMIYIIFNSWIIALEIIVLMIIMGLIIKKYSPLLKKIHKKRRKQGDKYTSLISESATGIREIKTLGIKKSLISNIKKVNDSYFKSSKTEIELIREYNCFIDLIRMFLETSVYATCIILVCFKQVEISFFVAMVYYVGRFTNVMQWISKTSQMYQKMIVALTRVNEILENKLYDDVPFGNVKLKNPKGIIEFKNVTFGYPNEDIILKNFNVKLNPGKKIAIVGSSGGGKSTLFNLLTRIFDPMQGEILIDGININDLREKYLRQNVSIIRQEPFVFNRTIKENFALVKENVTLEEIRKYTKMAYLDKYIMSLPKQYDTVLGERGVNLSGGQKQRLSIARTLLRNSKIILFDEATSALDNNSQEFIK